MNNTALKTVLLFVAGASAGGAIIIATRQPHEPVTEPEPAAPIARTAEPPGRDTQLEELRQLQYAALRQRQRQADAPPKPPLPEVPTPAAVPPPRVSRPVVAPAPARPSALPDGLTPDQQLTALQRRHIAQLDGGALRPLDLTRKTNPLGDMVAYTSVTPVPEPLRAARPNDSTDLMPRPDVPPYEVLHRIQEYRSTQVYAEVLVPALRPTSNADELARVAQLIAEFEGVDAMTLYCTREARQAQYDMDYATAHPHALRAGYLGDLERGRFRPSTLR